MTENSKQISARMQDDKETLLSALDGQSEMLRLILSQLSTLIEMLTVKSSELCWKLGDGVIRRRSVLACW